MVRAPYLPTIGRFLSIDPVEAGNPNGYGYPAGPNNGYDLNGHSKGGNQNQRDSGLRDKSDEEVQ